MNIPNFLFKFRFNGLKSLSSSKCYYKHPTFEQKSIGFNSTISIKQTTPISIKRNYCTQRRRGKKSKKTTLNDALRKLYMKVHPDLFTYFPHEQEVNEKSFQSLMSFLEECRTPDRFASSKTYELTFYVKDERQPSDNSGDINFNKVSVNLVSPNGLSDEKAIERIISENLKHLFSLFSIDCEFSMDIFKADKSRAKVERDWSEEFSLLHFLREVHSESKYISLERQKAEISVDLQKTSVFMENKIRVYFEFPEDINEDWKIRTSLEKEILLRLKHCIECLSEQHEFDIDNLRNITLLFGYDKRGIDLLGRICLNINDLNDDWINAIKNTDFEIISKIKENTIIRSEKENRPASKIGLAYFYTDFSLSNSVEYLEYLDKVNDFVDKSEKTFNGMQELKIRVVKSLADYANDRGEIKVYKDNTFSIDPFDCSITTTLDNNIETLFEIIEKEGDSIIKRHEKILKDIEDIYEVILRVKRKFRLKYLKHDNTMSKAELITCLKRLIQNAGSITPYMEGIRLFISDHYDFNKKSGTVKIRWDFLL